MAPAFVGWPTPRKLRTRCRGAVDDASTARRAVAGGQRYREQMAVRVTLAGRVGIEADGVAVDQGLGRLGRLALAYLVCERYRPVARDELAEVVWGDDLPSSWEQLLRGIAAKLRQCLRSAGLDPADALTTAFGAYQLHL